MKQIRTIALLLAVLMAFGAAFGCAGKKLAAKVGDREITVQQLENSYDNSSMYAMYYGYALDTAEGIESYQDYLLDSMVSEQAKAYEARLAGVTLTDEEQAEAQKTATESYDSTYQSFVDAAEQSGSADVKAYAQKLFTDALIQNGTTVSKLKKELLRDAEDAKLIEKHKEQLLSSVQMTPEELEAKFDEELATQKELFEADPAQYFTYESNATYGAGSPILYTPAGMYRVKHILVEDETTANDLKARLDAGEDFEALLTEFGTDSGMAGSPEGYLYGEGANFVEEFKAAAALLEKEGDVSEVTKSDYGYHILKRYADEPAHEATYEEVKDTFDAYAQGAVDDETYQGIVDGWLADAAVVTRYPENYRFIGKSALEA